MRSPIRRFALATAALAAIVAVVVAAAQTPRSSPAAQTSPAAPSKRSVISQSLTPPAFPQQRVDDALIEFPLAPGQERFRAIDGRKMHTYVVKLAEIARKYRDTVNKQFWGRITGTSADRETAEWVAAKYREFGMTDVRIQEIPLLPQWMAEAWKVEVISGGTTVDLISAQPHYETTAIPVTELDAVWVGRGAEADFLGRTVTGKAVFVETDQAIGNNGAVARAGEKGAAVVFEVSLQPGNMKYQSYPARGVKTGFTLGNDDGNTVRAIIEKAGGNGVKIRASLQVEMAANRKTALVWGTLPGTGDENVVITAHRDGWFDAATDNAAGVASQLGLAEYLSKVPRAQRKRSIVFVSLDGHHNGSTGTAGLTWVAQNFDTVFAKTALIFNDEHPAQMALQTRPRYYPGDEITWSNTYLPLQWFAGGSVFPDLKQISWNAFKEFGQSVQMDESPASPASDLTSLQGRMNLVRPNWRVQDHVALLDAGEYQQYFHTDWETPEQVPWTGLQASTRAFAKIFEEVDKLPIAKLRK